MRRIAVIASGLVIAAPLLSLGTGRLAHADTNDFVGQAQRFMNNRGDDRDNYNRDRDDEIRRQQAQRIGTTTGAIMIGIEPATIATGSQMTATVAANRDGGVCWFP
jgi:hypothetical protein